MFSHRRNNESTNRIRDDGFRQLRHLAQRKLISDFQKSYLQSPSDLENEKRRSYEILAAAGTLKDTRLRLLFRESSTRSSAYDGLSSKIALNLVRKHIQGHGKIAVLISSIAVGPMATLRSLQTRHAELKESLEIQYQDANGREQMRTLLQEGPVSDFVIAPDGAFFMSTHSVHDEYQWLTPFFFEDQYVLRRTDWTAAVGGTVWTFPMSAAETMIRALNPLGRDRKKVCEMEPRPWLAGMKILYCEAKDMPRVALNLDRPDMLVAWEPLASELIRQSKEQRRRDPKRPILEAVPGSWFPVVFSLSAHERWATKDRESLRNAFEELLIAEWNFCRLRPEYAWGLLANDLEFLQYFASAAGRGNCPVLTLPRNPEDADDSAATVSATNIQMDIVERARGPVTLRSNDSYASTRHQGFYSPKTHAEGTVNHISDDSMSSNPQPQPIAASPSSTNPLGATVAVSISSRADILIITALKEEYDEARKVDTGALDAWLVDRNITGFEVAFRTYQASDGNPLRIALTWATRMRTTATVDAAGRLLEKLGARCLAMSGVCAGRRGKVNPGDVIIGSLLYTYDTGAVRTEYSKKGQPNTRFQAEPNPIPLDEQWLHCAQAFKVTAAANFAGSEWLNKRPPTLEEQSNWLLAQLRANVDPASHAESARRCPTWKATVERLRKLEYVSAQPPLAITDSGAAHVDDLLLLHRGRLPEASPWRIQVAPIATGNNVMRDPRLFDRLSDSMRDVLGVEMEAAAVAAIAHARRLQWIVMKGVMDHADDDKDDSLKAFAARASAESLIVFLRENLRGMTEAGSS